MGPEGTVEAPVALPLLPSPRVAHFEESDVSVGSCQIGVDVQQRIGVVLENAHVLLFLFVHS